MQHENTQMSEEQIHDFCKNYKDHYIQMQTKDGQTTEGIIYKMDREHVYLLIPVGDDLDSNAEQHATNGYGYGFGGWGYGGYGYPGYGGYGYGGYYPRKFRRFRRFRYPFWGISRLFFPFFY